MSQEEVSLCAQKGRRRAEKERAQAEDTEAKYLEYIKEPPSWGGSLGLESSG